MMKAEALSYSAPGRHEAGEMVARRLPDDCITAYAGSRYVRKEIHR